jgi:hypothetical protein
MKKLLAIVVLGLLLNGKVQAKEIETVWGFKLKIPNGYEYYGAVIGEDIKIPEKYLRGVPNTNLLRLIPKSLDYYKNYIHVTSQQNLPSLKSMSQTFLPELCKSIKNTVDEKLNQNLKQHSCDLVKHKKFEAMLIVVSDTEFKNTLHNQITFNLKKNLITVSVQCEEKNCMKFYKDSDELINSIK